MFIDKKEGKNKKQKPPKISFSLCSFSSLTTAVEEITQVKLREAFPLLWSNDSKGQGRQSVENQLKPQLLNSYQGHKKSITGLLFFEKNQVLISSSVDKSVRLWNLSGQVRKFK
jgi:WD40 repeat protein